jgi:hypothetical protein
VTDAELRKLCITYVCNQYTLELINIFMDWMFVTLVLRILMDLNHQPSLHCLEFHHLHNSFCIHTSNCIL